jgi:hypothetical protein
MHSLHLWEDFGQACFIMFSAYVTMATRDISSLTARRLIFVSSETGNEREPSLILINQGAIYYWPPINFTFNKVEGDPK